MREPRSNSENALPPHSRLPMAIAAALVVLHVSTNGQYGFHRDELATLDDARHLAWGFVAYPPLTPFFGRISLTLFGISVAGARVFPMIAQAVATLCAGWMARELGGRRFAQSAAALAVAIAPISIVAGSLLQYVTFDYLWWTLVGLFALRMLRTEDPRHWVAIGIFVGLGMMTKYTMLFLVTGLLVGLAASAQRRLLATRWLWAGVAIAMAILLPNAIWQIQHQFITWDFLQHIHARDIRIGRTAHFFSDQIYINVNMLTAPLCFAGLYFYLRSKRGIAYRAMGWAFLVVLVLFVAGKARGYYMGPAYPMLLAAGAVLFERWTDAAKWWSPWIRFGSIALWTATAALTISMVLPIAPIGSHWFEIASKLDGDLVEEIGWPDLTQEVARIYNSLPPERKARTGILAANYGEAGAIDMYGPALGLPAAISGTNSYWLRGYGSNPPNSLIVLGLRREYADAYFTGCVVAGRNQNRFGVKNEESQDHPDIFLCDGMRLSWPEFWKHFRLFG